ncbi:MAG: DUF2520 domain-containing protein [Clostridiales bacterium]|nr:DUF2520 domain-containing protein [Clostridiales bacterium]
MKIGFVGAGKVGFSLGKYFGLHGADIGGYFSRNPVSARKAADFTSSRQYDSLGEILSDNDVLFLTVPDGEILPVWNSIKMLPCVKNKIICHCSGALSSDIFSDAEELSVYGFSLHPIFAFYSKTESYKRLSEAVFTVEGNPQKIDVLVSLVSKTGNIVRIIDGKDKAKYHASAVMASNFVTALIHASAEILCECGFSRQEAIGALLPLISGNLSNIRDAGTVQALTGPVERNDVRTVSRHLDCLGGKRKAVYRELSSVLVDIAKTKHPDRNYDEMEELLK